MNETHKDIKDIDERIAHLENKDKVDEKYTKVSNISNGFQIVIELASGVIVGICVGYVLDKIFDFRILFLVIFTILGGIAGLLNVVRYLKSKSIKERE